MSDTGQLRVRRECSSSRCQKLVDPDKSFVTCLDCRVLGRRAYWNSQDRQMPAHSVSTSAGLSPVNFRETGYKPMPGKTCGECQKRGIPCCWALSRKPRHDKPKCKDCSKRGRTCHVPESASVPTHTSAISIPHLQPSGTIGSSSSAGRRPNTRAFALLAQSDDEDTVSSAESAASEYMEPAAPILTPLVPAPTPAAPAAPTLDPEIVEIKPDPATIFLRKRAPHPGDADKLNEAVRCLSEPAMDPEARYFVVQFVKNYFKPRIGRKPSALESHVARTLLANERIDGDLRMVLRKFYQVLWI